METTLKVQDKNKFANKVKTDYGFCYLLDNKVVLELDIDTLTLKVPPFSPFEKTMPSILKNMRIGYKIENYTNCVGYCITISGLKKLIPFL